MVATAVRRGPVRAEVTRDVWDEAQMELAVHVAERRAEAAAAAHLIPFAKNVHQYVALDGIPQIERAQAAVVRYLERAARGVGDK